MRGKTLTIIILIILIFIGVIAAYWYFAMGNAASSVSTANQTQSSSGFSPYNTSNGNGGSNVQPGNNQSNVINEISATTTIAKIPILRLLSNTPVGGYGASTTATTTAIRWIDRGRGNVYEARSDTLNIATLSNTLLPRMYESFWNKNLTAFVGFTLAADTDLPSALYAQLNAQASSTRLASSTNIASSTMLDSSVSNTNLEQTPFSLRGNNLPDDTLALAVSPKKDKVFMFVNESGVGVGYVSSFNGTSVTRIFSTPLLQINVEWPEENTIAITTKGSAYQQGYMYFVNPGTGVWKKILGPIPGLSTRTSHDAKYVIYSTFASQGLATEVYNVADGSVKDAFAKTLADKCVWGNFYKNLVYCGVPAQPVAGTYPDDWYKGIISLPDRIWQINADTMQIKLISSIVDQSDMVIDCFNLGLDEKDDYLLFMDKNDLSLWSLDLVAKN